MIVTPSASVIIVTRNRCTDLKRALNSVVDQNTPIEVLVLDDGSTDNTAGMVRCEFPTVQLHSFHDTRGYIARRNQAAKIATAPIILSIDDDAEFSSPKVVEQTLQEFNHARIGAVAIPFANVPSEGKDHQLKGLQDRALLIDSYVGTSHALRRDIFLSLGGYREELVHQGEEQDFCLRMLAQGYVVRLGSADPILHYESPKRSFERMDYYGRRNDVLFAWQNVPWPFFPLHLLVNTVKGCLFAFRHAHHPRRMFAGMRDGFRAGVSGRIHRQPVNCATYLLHRRLKKRGPVPLQEIEDELAGMDFRES
jgi:glycosyltransferase involved in cell wall biosynthesis